ncbi:hypothetical protein HYDPIDRAFT_30008 [Hydnomerulius pinastri MD-312]|uniref:Unplaced genomic scaffold scaffold_19, whole genome shotgun sequence n=1 Tax=Hydnomerulius pinastri MD-312 TaxID=994086 RepID=A0A0C9WDY3_9AGAM|nr:hypothetical protein HYDPIDRAFT_30008 [Hydnomerulius pinastri MD-312]
MLYFRVAIPILTPLILLALKSLIGKRRENPAGLPLPPGPPRLPIVGNLFGVKDLGRQWLTYVDWSKKYGDLLYVEIFGQKLLILNSEKVAEELLDKRSQNYSDRPQVPMVTLMGWGFTMGLLPYGPIWRKHRKVMHQALNLQAVLNYRHIQLNKVRQLVWNILQAPDEMEAHLKTQVLCRLTLVYGYEMEPRNDLFASIVDRAACMLTNSFVPGAALVNAFPVFQYLPEWCPGAGFKKYANECKKLVRKLRDLPYEYVQKQMVFVHFSLLGRELTRIGKAEGIAPHSMVSEMLEHKEEEDVIKSVAGTVYAAAIETSSSALSAFVMAMIIFPSVQEKAQAEIDRITGESRLPDFSDRESMVYMEAIYREVLRWSQVTPLGVPHMTTNSDIYNGYFIPKDTVVFANIWSITHNEEKYPDPMRFMPERYIGADGQLTGDLAEHQFGFGRRKCVGKYLAEASVWIAMVSILAVFNLSKAKNEQGRDIDVIPEYKSGILGHPIPYSFSITPRSPRTARLAQDAESDGNM